MKKLLFVSLLLTGHLASAQSGDFNAKIDSIIAQMQALKTTATPTTWTKCASEGGMCAFTGTKTVRYGANGKYATKSLTGGTKCDNSVFGDPAPGLVKTCEIGSTSGTTPTPTPVPPSAGSGVFVGTTEYADLAAAGAAMKSGDTIRITKSIDNQSVAFSTVDTVNVACDPGVKITWSAGQSKRPAWGKGIFVVEGATKTFSITGCDVSGVMLNAADGGNAAAVRLSDGADLVTISNVYFHDNNNGILGGAKRIVIKDSKFDHNGVSSGAYDNVHNIYISAATESLEVSNSYFGRVSPAHLFKSRAKNTTVTGCQFETFANTDGSYLMDLPNGGNAVVSNSVFVKAPGQSQRGTFAYGEEGIPADGRVNKWEFKNNIVINDGNGRFINQSGGEMFFHDNIFVGPAMDGMEPMQAGANNKMFASRADAGLPSSGIPAAPKAMMKKAMKSKKK